jgi:hypothetical protein
MEHLKGFSPLDAILVVVDHFSRLANIVTSKTIMTTFNSTNLFFDTMRVWHDKMPHYIINDHSKEAVEMVKG